MSNLRLVCTEILEAKDITRFKRCGGFHASVISCSYCDELTESKLRYESKATSHADKIARAILIMETALERIMDEAQLGPEDHFYRLSKDALSRAEEILK